MAEKKMVRPIKNTPSEKLKYDLLVIGSGPAGQKAALAAAKQHARVALVEQRHAVGGVCLHTGTIPSKTMREAVIYFTGYGVRNYYGEAFRVKEKITPDDLTFRVEHVVRKELDVISDQMQRNGVDMVFGKASFDSPHQITVETTPNNNVTLTGRKIIIAVGAQPARPQHIPFTPGRIIDSDEVLHLQEIPRTMVIVGAGVIGCEYSSIFATLDVEVTLVESRDRILEFADREIVDHLIYHMRTQEIVLRLGEAVTRVFIDDQNRVVTELESGKRIISDTLLYAVGRQGAITDLKLEAAGLKADDRGRLKINECYQTEVEHIYAVGDVIGFPSLASTSMEQGRIAACNALDSKCETFSDIYPYGIYTIPVISMVGQSEESLTKSKVPYELGTARYGETAKGHMLGDPSGMLKILFHRESHHVLGVHAIGDEAAELIHIGQAVMAHNGKIDYFVNTIFNYPTLAEVYKIAAYNGLNKL